MVEGADVERTKTPSEIREVHELGAIVSSDYLVIARTAIRDSVCAPLAKNDIHVPAGLIDQLFPHADKATT